MARSYYIIAKGYFSMWAVWNKNQAWKSNVTKEEVSPLGVSMFYSINLIGISKVEKKIKIIN
jgi:hypothetical protein